MRKIATVILITASAASLTACGKSTGVFGRARPDELAVARAAPLVVPPDFALRPPVPGAPRPQEADSSTLALQAMFGGPAQRSTSEQTTLDAANAGRADAGIRSTVSDPNTVVVDKGAATRDVVAAPATEGTQGARATATPQ